MKLKELGFKGTFRDYQQKVLDESKGYLEDGKIHVVAAPGSGKTTLGLEFICRLGKPALVLAPSITIRQQWGERFEDDFLPEGEKAEDYISYHIGEPKDITCITYQALYSAMTGKEEEEEEEEEFEDESSLNKKAGSKTKLSQLDVAAIMKRKHITTICLDEAHHLRTEWHRSIMKLLDELDYRITIIALTATPPYDSTPGEWKKYIKLCGPIDAEISVPLLVKQKTLCPHQDLVYFSFPTREEQAKIKEYKHTAKQALNDVMHTEIFANAFAYFIENMTEYNEDFLYEHIEDFRSFLYCAEASGVEIPSRYRDIISERKKTGLFSKEMAQLGCQFVVDNPDLFGDSASEELLAFFRERHVADRKRINVVSNKTIASMLASSMGKLRGIQTIVVKETENLGEDLRMVILTDFIKKGLMKIVGTEDPISEMGTVPIFESLRRENISGTRLGVLSGTLTIIPDSALPKLKKLADKEECPVSFKPIRDTGFSQVEFGGGNKKKVRIVTELFRQGEINVMIGTKSLLGEGWDSPCINSLILASFVGSFMLSNQMRGRAIRVDKDHPEKVSNVWHLVTPEIDESVKGIIDDLLEGKSVYEDSMTLGDDYETIARRFECFMAPSLKEDVIQSGIERLDIHRFMGRSEIVETNQRMLDLSSDREEAKARWERSFDRCADGEMEVCQKNEFKEKALPTKHGFFNLASYLALVAAFTVLHVSIYKALLNDTGTVGTLLYLLVVAILYVVLARGIHFAIRLMSPKKLIESIAKAMLSAFQKNDTIRSDYTRVEVNEDRDGLHIYSTLRGGTLREKQLFAESMRELLSPMNNPRYVIIKREFHIPQYGWSMACPSLLGNNKQNAELFQKELEKQLGDVSVVYVRNEEGHKIYKKCVKKSLINLEINAEGSIVRKEVY